jgi:hypothetical protein
MDFPRSSVIASADYDPVVRALDIAFTSGRRYTYFGVPEQVFDALLTASSAGEYFNAFIRDQYASRKRS